MLTVNRPKATGCVYQQTGRKMWMIKYTDHLNREIRMSAGTHDEDEAKALLKSILGDVVEGKPAAVGRCTWPEAVALVEKDYRRQEHRSFATLQSRLKHLTPRFGRSLLAAITYDTLTTYVDDRRTAGASKATVQAELKTVSRLFSLAMEAERVYYKPRIPYFKKPDRVRKG